MASTFKDVYPADSSAITFTITSLATSSTRIAGAQSDQQTNTSNLDLDHLIGCKITLGTSPTANKQVDLWVIPCYKYSSGTPTFPDVFTGAGTTTKSATSLNVLNGCGFLLKSWNTDATTNLSLYGANLSVAGACGGEVPPYYVLFLAHDSAVNLNSTGGNHEFDLTRIQKQAV